MVAIFIAITLFLLSDTIKENAVSLYCNSNNKTIINNNSNSDNNENNNDNKNENYKQHLEYDIFINIVQGSG